MDPRPVSDDVACRVQACRGARRQAVEAGLDLCLCGRHLGALRRMCKGKHRLPYAKIGVREAERLTAAGAAGDRPGPYRCGLCEKWHVGNQHGGRGPVDGVRAAAAVRATLTAGQLKHLIFAWRPHTRGGRAIAPSSSNRQLPNGAP